MGMPKPGPIVDLAAAKVQLGIPPEDTKDDEKLTEIAAAVDSWVGDLPIVAKVAAEAAEWPSRITLGAALMAARLFRRKNSPAGVEGFGQNGAVYVRRNDPDIGLMLQLGDYAKPSVG